MTTKFLFSVAIGLIVATAGLDQLWQGHNILGAFILIMAGLQFVTVFKPTTREYDLGFRHGQMAKQDPEVGERKSQKMVY